MRPPPPNFPRPTAEEVIARIHRAFDGVLRDEGISWSECVVLDNYGSPDECAAARKLDRESHWSKLIDDSKWQPFPGTGGFSFIDALGFRYYLPPTMIRFARGDISESPELLLSAINRFVPENVEVFDDSMRSSIALFILYMTTADPHCTDDEDNPWLDDLHMRWQAYLPHSD